MQHSGPALVLECAQHGDLKSLLRSRDGVFSEAGQVTVALQVTGDVRIAELELTVCSRFVKLWPF